VYLGGERRIDVARASGYKDGSAITQFLKRLRNEAQSKPSIATRMARVETEMDSIPSIFKTPTPGAQRGQRQPATLANARSGKKPPEAHQNMDQSVKKCRLTPIFLFSPEAEKSLPKPIKTWINLSRNVA
jgi:hypothetical protein